MVSDYFHVYPTDGLVNNKRGRYPFGIVDPSRVKWKSQNNSKVGKSMTPGYSGTVFEPIDEFKGDIARALLYFAVRYQKQVGSFGFTDILDGSSGRVYKPWFISLLLKWHKMDPPSDWEKRRNVEGQKFQGNRNPFTDYPEMVEKIWNYNAKNQYNI